jgi:hypothetical protein
MKLKKLRSLVAGLGSSPIQSYDSTESAMFEYFDRNLLMVSDEKKFKFRNVIPVDRYGYVRTDILFREKRSGEWKTVKTFPFQKDEIWVKLTGISTELFWLKKVRERPEFRWEFMMKKWFTKKIIRTEYYLKV